MTRKVVATLGLILSLVLVLEAKWHIGSHTNDQDVSLGDDITLMCRAALAATDLTSDANWKTCVWTREGDSSMCMMEYKCVKNCNPIMNNPEWTVTQTCSQSLGNVTFFGSDPSIENHICGIVVPASQAMDNSDWTCDLEECKTVGGCFAENGSGTHAKATMKVTVH